MVQWVTNVPGISNFRDLSSGSFPAGLVYRSADLSQLPSTSLAALAERVDIIIDVRSQPEIKRNGTVGPVDATIDDALLSRHGIRRIHAPIFKETDYSPEAIAGRHQLYQSGTEGFIAAYRGILDHCGPTLQTLFSVLAAKSSIDPHLRKGILIHCSAGKDRTGILCALLLLLADASPDDVATEYALTTQGLASHKERIVASLGDVTKVNVEKVNAMMSSEAVVMRRTVDVIDQDYGGVKTLVRKSVAQGDFDKVKKLVKSSATKL